MFGFEYFDIVVLPHFAFALEVSFGLIRKFSENKFFGRLIEYYNSTKTNCVSWKQQNYFIAILLIKKLENASKSDKYNQTFS